MGKFTKRFLVCYLRDLHGSGCTGTEPQNSPKPEPNKTIKQRKRKKSFNPKPKPNRKIQPETRAEPGKNA